MKTSNSNTKENKHNPDIENDICPICIESFENDIVEYPCGHWFHPGCSLKWLGDRNDGNLKCPTCRQLTSVIDMNIIIQSDNDDTR